MKQILFPGAHADVGGGYPEVNNESDLSDSSLIWMSDELKAIGIGITQSSGFDLAAKVKGPAHQPWRNPIWKTVEKREFLQDIVGHCSIGERAKVAAVRADPSEEPGSYRPLNMPAEICGGPSQVTAPGFPGTSLCARCRQGA